MKEVNFYEVNSDNFEKTLCSLIEKCYSTGKNSFVHTVDEGMQEIVNKTLWTFSQRSFIPHGSINDERPLDQPILISHKTENLNNATFLVLVGGAYTEIDSYERVFIVFHSESERQKTLSRQIYADLKAKGHTLSLFKQNAKGVWEKSL